MQLLNSILIEGTVIDVPAYLPAASEDSIDRCSFSLDCGPSAPSIPILVYHRLALRCHELLDKHSSVRVVGRVIHDTEASAATGNFPLAVVAEHVCRRAH
jgi:hypothetical protein